QDSVSEQPPGQAEKAVPKVESPPPSKKASSYVVKGKRYFVKSDAAGHEEKGTASWYGKRFHGRRTSSGERYDMHAMTAAHKNLPISSLIQVTNLDNGLSTLVRVNDRGPFHGNRVLDLSYAAASQLNMVDKGSAKVTIQVVEPGRPKLEKGLQEMFVAASDKARTGGEAIQDPLIPTSISTEPMVAATTETDILGSPLVTAQPKPNPKTFDTSSLYLQVGAFENRSTAEELRQALVAKLEEGVLVQTDVSNASAPYRVQIGPVDSQDKAQDLSRKLASLGVGNPRVVSR
ncbi:MAG: septal ring lytic transglycosylase RlpA family protein, partial [Chromatiaceae bacterium]|nr:septal ring lytic transglycosylase RlpA family protein [Chromatiaceae bacterium]